MKVKNDPRSEFSNLSNWKEEAWKKKKKMKKKNQGFNGIRGGHGFESRWSPDFFQASSFQLLKLENSLRGSFFAFRFSLFMRKDIDRSDMCSCLKVCDPTEACSVYWFTNVISYATTILLRLNPTVNNHHIQLVHDQDIYEADFGHKSSKNMPMHMFWCPHPLMLLLCVLMKLNYSLIVHNL